jgi:hypothetical protein
MNSKFNPPLPNKILVNGCSQSQAWVIDGPSEDMQKNSWPSVLQKISDFNLVNLATNGKDNSNIILETQRYLLNYNDVSHVVLQLTVNNRINLYRQKNSFKFIPNDPITQFDRLADLNGEEGNPEQPGRYPRYYLKIELPCPIWLMHKGEKKRYEIGDSSLFYHRLNTATQLFNLYFYCFQNNIGLTVIPFDSIGDREELQDNAFVKIPKRIYLQNDIQVGFMEHLNSIYPHHGGHFEILAHQYIAEKVYDHIKENKHVEINHDLIKRSKFIKPIYHY